MDQELQGPMHGLKLRKCAEEPELQKVMLSEHLQCTQHIEMDTLKQENKLPMQNQDVCEMCPGENQCQRKQHESVHDSHINQQQDFSQDKLQSNTPLYGQLPSEEQLLQTSLLPADLLNSLHGIEMKDQENIPVLQKNQLIAQDDLQDSMGELHLEQDQAQASDNMHGAVLQKQTWGCMKVTEKYSGRDKHHTMDTCYPEFLPTEEPPRRRAISLPLQLPQITEEGKEEETGGSLMGCCKLKKRVKFADSLGLCLASVKHFLSSDEPLVPSEVLARLQSDSPDELGPEEDLYWEQPPQPPALNYKEQEAQLKDQRVCLEHVSPSSLGVRGSVLVQEPGNGVQVIIRYTFNEWLSYMECSASTPEPSASTTLSLAPGVQRFIFTLCHPPTTSRIHFAICCNIGLGQQLWDNNQGSNYTVICHQELPQDVQDAESEQDSWGAPRHW
ncbi:protein phosphatase 1 regulatory subunit 3G [Discoglossus pictus]